MTGFLGDDSKVTGVRARDLLDDSEIEIRGAVTVNACGPWVANLCRRVGRNSAVSFDKGLVKGMNLVTRRICGEHAIGVESKRASDAVIGDSQRLYFITPWRSQSLIGTTQFNYDGTKIIYSNFFICAAFI